MFVRVDIEGQNSVSFPTFYTNDPDLKWLTTTSMFSLINFDMFPEISASYYTYATNETVDDYLLFPVGSSVVSFHALPYHHDSCPEVRA